MDLKELGDRDHCCLAFDDDEEFSSRAMTFLQLGIERGLQGALVTGSAAETVEDRLRVDGHTSDLLESGALEVWSVADTYAEGDPEPDAQVEFYAEATRDSLSKGFRGLRIAADATALIDTPERADVFARYEHLVDRFMASNPFSAMCGYKTGNGTDEQAVTQVAALHPVAIGSKTPLRFYAVDDTTFGLEGEIDFWSARLLEATLRRADPAEQGTQIFLDLSRLDFMDHHGISALVEYAVERGAHFMLTNPPSHVSRLVGILDVTRLTVATS